MQTGIAGSAQIEGTSRTVGIMDNGTPDVVKRAMIIWGLALVALMAFHVGGSRL